MSAEQTPDIETAVWNVCDQIIADHPMWIGDDGRPLNYLPEREARIADFVRELADASAQALAPVLAAAVREAAPTHAKLREAGWKTPDELAAVRAKARQMVLALASEYRPMVDQGSGSYLNPRVVVARLEELADRVAEPQHEAATSGKESEARDE